MRNKTSLQCHSVDIDKWRMAEGARLLIADDVSKGIMKEFGERTAGKLAGSQPNRSQGQPRLGLLRRHQLLPGRLGEDNCGTSLQWMVSFLNPESLSADSTIL